MSEELKRMRSKFLYSPMRRAASALGVDIARSGTPAPLALEEGDSPALHETFSFPEDKALAANYQFLLTPREQELQADDLLRFLEDQGLSGLYIPGIGGTKLKLCFLRKDKLAALRAIALFCSREGARLRYRVRGEGHETTDVATYLDDFAGTDHAMMRIISLRSVEEIQFFVDFWTEEDEFFSSAGPNHLSRRLWKGTAAAHGFFEPGPMRDYSAMLGHPHETVHQFPVDLVFTWVNADDPEWQKLYRAHTPDVERDGTSLSRFHSRDELKYALRSWDTYAPFVRKIFVVSNCAPPTWLDTSTDRLEWVPHEDILPASALPTFSSHAIETSLHKIPGLADHFIYSNDDFLLTRPAHPHDFFLPSGIAKVRLEPYGMVNGPATEGHPDYLNGARNANTLIENELGVSTTQLVTHSPQPLRKDVMDELDVKFPEPLDQTAHNKFRTTDDVAVTGYLHAHYAIAVGKAISDTTPVQLIQQNHQFKKILAELVAKKAQAAPLPLSICLNDGAGSHLNTAWNDSVSSFLEAFYPASSSFEK